MLTFELFGGPRELDPLVLLTMALGIDLLLPGRDQLFRLLPHPVAMMGWLIGFLDRKLNRDYRSTMDRAIRGAVVVLFCIALALAISWGVLWVGRQHPYGWALEEVMLVLLLAQHSLYAHVRAVRRALEKGGLDAGRAAVSRIVGRDPTQLDVHGVARAAIESCAENFSDGVVAPVFWYLLFGLPGIMVYKTVNTLDSMIGHKTERHTAFGFVAAKLDDLLNLVPARLSGLILVIAALFVPTAKPLAAMNTIARDATKHRSPNAGWPEAAAAGALGLALSGPRFYSEGPANDPWLGSGRAQATPADIGRMLYLYGVGCLIDLMAVAAIALIRL
jgi:adenosylcobinamide-phosphate synthase